MKKSIAFLLCLIMIASLCSCIGMNNTLSTETGDDTEDITEPVDSESTTEALDEENNTSLLDPVLNGRARHAYAEVIRNEKPLYYTLQDGLAPYEMYFSHMCNVDADPSGYVMVDMDGDGVEELILSYTREVILLHYENNLVYGMLYEKEAMQTVFADGSYSWSSDSEVFGYEYGVSRISFVNGVPKYQELWRIEQYSTYYINGVQVTENQFYAQSYDAPSLRFQPFDLSMLDADAVKAIELASEHWGIRDGDFDPETGYRYRIRCTGMVGDQYEIYLYGFVGNQYYLCLEIALVNVETGGITVSSDGK